MGRKFQTILSAAVLGAGALTLGAASVPAAAAAADQPGRSCFRLSQVQSMRPDGDQKIYAALSSKRVYRIDLAYQCSALKSDHGLVLETAGGNDLVCSAIDLDIGARNLGGGVQPCFPESITALTPEEAAALPKRLR